ncbi:MAG: transcriptional regulator SpxA [Alkalibacterium gilvum]|uniref:Global transcriptional regulator Spx n=1 Tax=Alkalibacterium gilvum TaxID=1130080 RepID=A0A1H6TQ57_9LACT|nr:transcriptional regulator SpxA [Alkalibacterium gilvum]MDN6293159.1 transcriptional regulator SpxA [Alkalibacterium sp.]SEI77862.1 regulatory protein spx [Alkalibacterium gilvum]HAJ69869.1 transcriptional regulator Spx [Alkalibacterium sp.]
MVTLFTTPSCTSCRKAKAWLEEYGISYTEKNMAHNPLKINEIKAIMRLTEDGTEDIISTRSKAFKELNVDIDELSLKELFMLIQENPTLIRRPIILDEKRLQIGYNEDEIRQFVPREIREIELKKAQQLVSIK